jgi:prepilin-type N-terminal cleavage/methylation domain-containing protein
MKIPILNRHSESKGMTLIEILVGLAIIGVAVTAYVRTSRPSLSINNSSRKSVDITSALAEILDSLMVQPVASLDGASGSTFHSRQGVDVILTTSSLNQSAADAIVTGLDISRMRTLMVKAVSDSTRKLSTTVSNYQEQANSRCYTQ